MRRSRVRPSIGGAGLGATLAVTLTIAAAGRTAAQADSGALMTPFAAAVSRTAPWPEYPRPQLARAAWLNLNGPWQYAITDTARDTATGYPPNAVALVHPAYHAPGPARWDGTILVPFPVESELSGVRRPVSPSEWLWYRRTFTAPAHPRGGRVLLHFGAVDWETTVWVNGARVATHRGGYDPFTADITGALRRRGPDTLVVRVWDPSDSGDQPRGKQVLRPRGIWYTATTGIWQTVWLEAVPATYVAALHVVPDLPDSTLKLVVDVAGRDSARGALVRATAFEGDGSGSAAGRVVARAEARAGDTLRLVIPHARPWSPESPFLYGLTVRLPSGDSIDSYFGLRSIAVGRDAAGFNRLLLNGHPLFELGTLDQGFWPDGLYTPPSDSAIRFDLGTLKRLGFNLARKHVKVEPDRWYYWADRLGLLVWQDMPSGNNAGDSGKAEFERELEAMVRARANHPAIVMWVPFNEGWGEHDARRYAALVHALDPTRLVDDASGWTDAGAGDVHDIHDYPGPSMPDTEPRRAVVLGEFGGLGLPVPDHLWNEKSAWGYERYASRDTLAANYLALLRHVRGLEALGLAAAVYTQTTDVETEVNGLMTYDRRVVKLPDSVAAVNRALWAPAPR